MTRKRGSKKKLVLVDTALALFLRYGLKRVTVSEVCAEADVSKVTFYKHFSNKVDLAKRVIEVLSDRILERIDEITSMDVPLPDKVKLLVDERVRMAREWSPNFIDDLYHADEELAELFAERAARSRQRYVDFLRDAQASGEMRAEIAPDVLLGVLDKLYELGADETLVAKAGGFEGLTRDVNNIFFYGVMTRD